MRIKSFLSWVLLFQLESLTDGFTLPQQNLPSLPQYQKHSCDYKPLFCQLLGMNCAKPTDFSFSFSGFILRGGNTDIHQDGWGIAFYPREGQGIRLYHDTDPAATSPIANFLTTMPFKTLNFMAHIRFATQGNVNLANVHPFSREMWGVNWCFAHNGDIPLFHNFDKQLPWLGEARDDDDQQVGDKQIYYPVGDTDSEAVFCSILNALRHKFDTLPSLPVLHGELQNLMTQVVAHAPSATIFNCLLTCGPHVLWVYSWPGARPGSEVWNGLHYTIREYPFGTCRLSDTDYQVDFANTNNEGDRVAVIATKPLTEDEEWIEIERGELILFDEGLPHRTPSSCIPVQLQGHGLSSKVLEKLSLEEDVRRYRFHPSTFNEGAGI